MGDPKIKKKPVGVDLVAGGMAAAVARTSLSPFERVKVVLQTQSINQGILKSG